MQKRNVIYKQETITALLKLWYRTGSGGDNGNSRNKTPPWFSISEGAQFWILRRELGEETRKARLRSGFPASHRFTAASVVLRLGSTFKVDCIMWW